LVLDDVGEDEDGEEDVNTKRVRQDAWGRDEGLDGDDEPKWAPLVNSGASCSQIES
jgi:hypothetical protein